MQMTHQYATMLPFNNTSLTKLKSKIELFDKFGDSYVGGGGFCPNDLRNKGDPLLKIKKIYGEFRSLF